MIKEDLKTIDYIYDLPDGERAELIDGVIYDMALPTVHHQRIVRELSTDLANHIRDKNGECEVFFSPFAVFLNNDDPKTSSVCPGIHDNTVFQS